ncbi:MAG: acetyl-CoA carboxylase, biotin carboxyl carrier protein [Sphingobium sp.]|nr:acetyl-CoA carboxylase, biotin carboxyl carrier protein [Sphingobium sp.]
MSLTAKDVEEIMKLLDASSFDRLSLEVNGMKIELERSGAAPRAPATPLAPAAAPVAPTAPAATVRTSTEPGLVEVRTPLLGIYYRAPKPGEPPFVEVGSKVDLETVIGIVEVMKLMNSVPAGVKGEVVEILGRNGALVEHGEVLMLVRPEAG